MSAQIFVDTNVLVYALDRGAGDRHRQARRWLEMAWREQRGRVSVQVLQELYVVLTRKLRPGLPPKAAREEVRGFLPWQPLDISTPLLEAAWTAQDRWQLSWWDGLIVAAAQSMDCRVLLTEDLQDGQDLDGLLIVNPFAHQP